MAGILKFNKNAAPNGGDGEGTPPSGVPFQIDILELKPSKMNPRKAHAGGFCDDYESLKTSIRNIGLQSTLTVTKQDGTEYYELFNGGNTRLKVLTELYEEYLADGNEEQANKCRYQQVIFVPYTDDLDVLVKHMAENEERINMTFIDKARAVYQIRQLYLAKHDAETISSRKLVDYIRTLGWTSINQRSMTELNFAYEKLDHAIPLALNSGMGKSKIQQLRLWLSYAIKYINWLVERQEYDYSAEQTEALYLAVLSEFDDDIEPINLNDFYQDFIFKFSSQLMQFDNKLRAEKVTFELNTIEEVGEVMEERDPKELSRELQETSKVPPMQYPKPRKPREPKQTVTVNNKGKTVADTGNNVQTGGVSSGTEGNDIPPSVTGNISLPPAPVVSNYVSNEALLADCQEQVKTILDAWVERYKMSVYPTNFLTYGDMENDMHYNTPFFTLDISDENLMMEITKIIISGTWSEQYTMLHLLYVYSSFMNVGLDPIDFTEAEKLTHKNLKRIWAEHCHKYAHYRAMCEFNFIRFEPLQNSDMMSVHNMANQHIACIHTVESQLDEVSSGGGD